MKIARLHYSFEERMDCPLCGSAQLATLYSSPFSEGPVGRFIADYYGVQPAVLSRAPYELARCMTCRLVFQRWVGDDELLSELYGNWINEHCLPDQDPQHQDLLAHHLESRDAHEILTAARFLGLAPQQMVTLDYGMGWALWAKIARRLGCNSHGFDLSPSRMDYARKHGVTGVEADGIDEPKFHFINVEQVMEHVARPRQIAARLATALLPGGILKISVPSGKHVDEIVKALTSGRSVGSRDDLMPVQPLEHINTFTRYTLGYLAQKLGLRMVRPSVLQSYAFVRTPGAIRPKHWRRAAKELIRPMITFRNPSNLYVWLQKPA